MGIFLAKNGYLPCPAAINLNKSSASYGAAAATCSAAAGVASGYWKSTATASPNLYYGMVPTKTLGLSSDFSEDGFGAKMAYLTFTGFTTAANFSKGVASVASSTNYANNAALDRIIIKEQPVNESVITNDAMFAIISYGTNKNAAWNSNATAQNTVSTDAQEIENDANSLDATTGTADFDNIIFASSTNSENFDDIVFYKSRDEMTLDFGLLGLVACDEASPTQVINYGGTNYNYNWSASTSVKYGEAIASSESCPGSFNKGPAKPTKKCGAFGKWEGDVIENCIQ